MGLKDSPNRIQEPVWILPQPLAMTFPVIQIRSGKLLYTLMSPPSPLGTSLKGSTFPCGLLDPIW